MLIKESDIEKPIKQLLQDYQFKHEKENEEIITHNPKPSHIEKSPLPSPPQNIDKNPKSNVDRKSTNKISNKTCNTESKIEKENKYIKKRIEMINKIYSINEENF